MTGRQGNPLRGLAWAVLAAGAAVGIGFGVIASWFGGIVVFIVGALLAGVVDAVGAEATTRTPWMVLGGGVMAAAWMLSSGQVGVALIIGVVSVGIAAGLWVAQRRGLVPATRPPLDTSERTPWWRRNL